MKKIIVQFLPFLIFIASSGNHVFSEDSIHVECTVQMEELSLCDRADHDRAFRNPVYIGSSGAGSGIFGSVSDGRVIVDHMAKSFLINKTRQAVGFAHYSYLLMSDTTRANRDRREAVARAVQCLLRDVAAANDLGLNRSRLAVLLIPIKRTSATISTSPQLSEDTFLSAYDHAYAIYMRTQISRALSGSAKTQTIPSISLVGSARPLLPNAVRPADVHDVQVLDLSGSPQEIERKIINYRNSLLALKDDFLMGENILLRAKKFFTHLGNLVTGNTALAHGVDTRSHEGC